MDFDQGIVYPKGIGQSVHQGIDRITFQQEQVSELETPSKSLPTSIGSKDNKEYSRLLRYLQIFHSSKLSNDSFALLLKTAEALCGENKVFTNQEHLDTLQAILDHSSAASGESQNSSPTELQLKIPSEYLPTLKALKKFDAACCDTSTTEAINKSLHWLGQTDSNPRSIICFEDKGYPEALKQIANPPPILFVEGNESLLLNEQVAVVGSRRATAHGKRTAHWLASSLSKLGVTVISGLAMGIDAAAHQGALEGYGKTIAIVGTGMDQIYPARNRHLDQIIRSEGVLVSEFPLGTSPRPHHFPQRNRIIAGMSLATVVVEAQTRSGSLVTARLALEQNREVFAVPGAIDNSCHRGCHELIREGAYLVENTEDILRELKIGVHEKQQPASHPEKEQGKLDSNAKADKGLQQGKQTKLVNALLQLLKNGSLPFDLLAQELAIEHEDLANLLGTLEEQDHIETVSGRIQLRD